MAIVQLTHSCGDQEVFDVTLTPTDVDGNPTTKLGSGIVWSSSDTAIATVAPAADTLSAVVSSTGQDGLSVISAKIADPDPEEMGEEEVGVEIATTFTEQSVSGLGATISANRPR